MNHEASFLKTLLRQTLPVMTGYLFLGAAYGIYMRGKGLPALYAIAASVFVYAGSMQFVLANLLCASFAPLGAFLLTLMVNARHLFYGVSMLERYATVGKAKWYMIFGLTDETFSINVSAQPPEGIDANRLMLWTTILDQSYWVLGTLIGALLGSWLHFDTEGLDFVMTALFVVIFVEQWLSAKEHAPALIGVGASLLCLLVLGASSFILPAMALILLLLLGLRGKLSKEGGHS